MTTREGSDSRGSFSFLERLDGTSDRSSSETISNARQPSVLPHFIYIYNLSIFSIIRIFLIHLSFSSKTFH